MCRRARPRARRAPLPALAAAVLALLACKVDVEGAPCTTPGATADCPSGQACGNDLKCGERAAACAATRCDVGAASCVGADGSSAGSEFVKACTRADPACGKWELVPCASRGLECRPDGGTAACECPANGGTDFVADPLGSPATATPHATGLDTPRECRFRRLGDALEAAAAVGSAATVHVRGGPGPLVFGDAATGETFPLWIPETVSLLGAEPPSGPTVIRVESDNGPFVALAGALQGFRVESAAATSTAIGTTCANATSPRPSLTDVTVDGGGKLTAGIAVSGLCGAVLARVDVARAGVGLMGSAGSATVDVTGSTFHECAYGIQATGGKLTIGPDPVAHVPSTVKDNHQIGVYLEAGEARDATLDGVIVSGNEGTGIVIRSIPTTSKVTIKGCDVHSNGTKSPETYGPIDNRRPAGGILVSQASLSPFTFTANRVYGNAGDQLAFESSQPWSISPGACGAASNAFGCVAVGAAAVAVVGGGTVNANYTVWPGTPSGDWVYGNVQAGWCTPSLGPNPPVPSCPAP